MLTRVLLAVTLTLCPVVMAAAQPTPTPLSADPEIQTMMERLLDVPVLYNMDTPAVHDIFTRGQQFGNRANVFTKVGDSNTTNGDFLQPLGMKGDFCELGPYADLQETINFFSVPPTPDEANSFVRQSVAAKEGLSSAAALDPFWAGEGCEPNEGPLACEYRLIKPGVAVMMLGLMDVRYKHAESFRTNIEKVIQLSIDHGVIPVLTTIIVLPDQERLSFDDSIRINNHMLDMADQYGVPVINLWAAVQSLPDYGIGPDRTHLKARLGEFCSFDGAEQELGGTLRNLLTLQALDELRRNVLASTG
ncbi:MAG: hypothetical protein HZC41_25875 [Chloroflexi bacterium]|nr:hypothetical protein [Chloroflexota bacterium]